MHSQVLKVKLRNYSLLTKFGAALMKPEESARKKIDDLLELAGWKLQDYENLNLGAGVGIAVGVSFEDGFCGLHALC